MADGVLALGSGQPTWVSLPPPTRRDAEDIAVAIVRGISKMLAGRGRAARTRGVGSLLDAPALAASA